MIRPFTGKDVQPHLPTVIDLETAPNGDIIAVGFAYCDSKGNNIYAYYDDLLEWYRAYNQLLFEYRGDRYLYKRITRLYAHNGANFDYLSIYERLYASGAIIGGQYFMADSTGIGVQFTFEGQNTVTLFDSYRLLPASLDKLSQTYGIENKKLKHSYTDYAQFKRDDYALFYEYLRNDVLGLQQIILAFWRSIYDRYGNVGQLPMTLPALALRVFTKQLDAEILVPTNPQQKQLERDAYKGGLTLCMRTGVYDSVNVYDVNSMYPAQMARGVYPIGYSGYWTRTFMPDSVGLWRCEYEQTNTRVPPFLFDATLGASYTGSGVYTSKELVHLSRIGGHYRITEGYVYRQTGNLFAAFISDCYNQRKLAQQAGDEALSFTLKIMMNSLYGKFAQREEGHKVIIADADTQKQLIADKIPYTCMGNFIAIPEAREVPHAFVAIAAMITADARVSLHAKMCELINNGYDVYYCDTDSIHTNGTLAESNELGELKLEFNGRGAYAGRKLYALNNADSTKIRAKGIGRRIIGDKLSYERICELATDSTASQAYTFEVFPSVKEVLSGKAPSAVIHNKTRRIKNTGGIWDKGE